jgi:predicted ribosomally synthesized peptide with nif11-like leader
MSADQLSALVAAATADAAVAARFTQAATADEVVAIAASLGYDVTVEEVEAFGSVTVTRELSDAELAGVAGGGSPSLDPMLCPTGHCQSMYGLGCG